MSRMRWILSAMLALGLAVGVAGTASANPVPDFGRPVPYPAFDANPAHWTGVVIDCDPPGAATQPGDYATPSATENDPCLFTFNSPNLVLTNPAIGGGAPLINCNVTLLGKIWRFGQTQIYNVVTAPGHPNCANIVKNQLPWANQFCERIADANGNPITHEYWDGLFVNFTLAPFNVVGHAFAKAIRNGAGGVTGFNAVNTNVQGSVPPTFHLQDAANAAVTPNPAFTINSIETAPCKWQ